MAENGSPLSSSTKPIDDEKSVARRIKDRLGGIDGLNLTVQAATVVGSAVAGPLAGTAVGLVGVLVSGRLGQYADKKQHKLKDAVHDLLEQIRHVEDRIDQEFVRSDEFLGLSLRAHQVNLNASRDEKLGYIRNFLINSTFSECSRDPDKEMYLHLIDVLTFNQLEYFLAFCRSIGGGDLKRFLTRQEENGLMLSSLAEQICGVNASAGAAGKLTEELQIAFRILASYGLARAVERNPGMVTYHYETTLFTWRFARFVASPAEILS